MIRCYTTEHQHSRVIMHAFAEGCAGKIVSPAALLDGPAAMYGILRGTGEIIKRCERVGREYFYIDHGYIKAGHYEGYYRISRNGRQTIIDPDYGWSSKRFDELGVELKPWRKTGRNILVIPPTGPIAQFYNMDPGKWLGDVTFSLAKHTDRPVQVKKKDEGELMQFLSDCWCVVTHSSNVAVDALIEGVPVITLGESIAQPLSWSFVDIERPHWPERGNWVRGVACQQWRLDEMRRGVYAEFAGIERRVAA